MSDHAINRTNFETYINDEVTAIFSSSLNRVKIKRDQIVKKERRSGTWK
jgi:hypothetical protein